MMPLGYCVEAEQSVSLGPLAKDRGSSGAKIRFQKLLAVYAPTLLALPYFLKRGSNILFPKEHIVNTLGVGYRTD